MQKCHFVFARTSATASAAVPNNHGNAPWTVEGRGRRDRSIRRFELRFQEYWQP
jgi:hypothetical protein